MNAMNANGAGAAQGGDTTSPRRLTLDVARRLFDEMTVDASPDFSLIEQYYDPDVRFRDPIQQVEGREAFIEMSNRLIQRCRELRGHVNDAAQTGDVIFLQWTMELQFGRAPMSSIEGATKLRLGPDGRVVEHRDYFDLWGDTLDRVPVVGDLYRRFVQLMG